MLKAEKVTERKGNGFVIIHDDTSVPAPDTSKTVFSSHGHTLGPMDEILIDVSDYEELLVNLETLLKTVSAKSTVTDASSDYIELANTAVATIEKSLSLLETKLHERLKQAQKLYDSQKPLHLRLPRSSSDTPDTILSTSSLDSLSSVDEAQPEEPKEILIIRNKLKSIQEITFELTSKGDIKQTSKSKNQNEHAFVAITNALSKYSTKLKEQYPKDSSSARIQLHKLEIAAITVEEKYKAFLTFLLKDKKQQLAKVIVELRDPIKKRKKYGKDYEKSISTTRDELREQGAIDSEAIKPIVDARFRDVAYIPVKVGDEPTDFMHVSYTSVKPSASSSTAEIAVEGAVPSNYFVMANCLFGQALSCETTREREVALIDHSLVSELFKETVLNIKHDLMLSPYEMVMFAQFEHQLKLAKSLSPEEKFKLFYHLPTIGYELSGVLLHIHGKFSSGGTVTQFAKYIGAIEKRSKAHYKIITNLCKAHGIDLKNVVIVSPFDNLYSESSGVKNIYDFAGKHMGIFKNSTDAEIVDDVLNRLITNRTNLEHQEAWSAALPKNISEARLAIAKSVKTVRELTDPKLKNLASITNMEELIQFANSMMIAIARNVANNEMNAKVITIHSFDERPIVGGYGKHLLDTFGAVEAMHVLPAVICQNGVGDRLFQISPQTATKHREEIVAEIKERYKPSKILSDAMEENIDDMPLKVLSTPKSLTTAGIPRSLKRSMSSPMLTRHVNKVPYTTAIAPANSAPHSVLYGGKRDTPVLTVSLPHSSQSSSFITS